MFDNILKNVDRLSKSVLGSETTDSAKSNALRMSLENLLEGEGKVESFKIDTTAKSCFADLKLDGESESIRIDVNRYSVECNGADRYIVIHEATTSRKWLNRLLTPFIPYRFKVPEQYGALAALL